MKPKTTITNRTMQPRLSLRGQVLLRNRDGEISDVTHGNVFGLKAFAENGRLAAHILDQFRKRLTLLHMATVGRRRIDTGVVELVIRDLKGDLETGSALASYIDLTHELFEHSQSLDPESMPSAQNTGPASGRARPQQPAMGTNPVSPSAGIRLVAGGARRDPEAGLPGNQIRVTQT